MIYFIFSLLYELILQVKNNIIFLLFSQKKNSNFSQQPNCMLDFFGIGLYYIRESFHLCQTMWSNQLS